MILLYRGDGGGFHRFALHFRGAAYIFVRLDAFGAKKNAARQGAAETMQFIQVGSSVYTTRKLSITSCISGEKV